MFIFRFVYLSYKILTEKSSIYAYIYTFQGFHYNINIYYTKENFISYNTCYSIVQ